MHMRGRPLRAEQLFAGVCAWACDKPQSPAIARAAKIFIENPLRVMQRILHYWIRRRQDLYCAKNLVPATYAASMVDQQSGSDERRTELPPFSSAWRISQMNAFGKALRAFTTSRRGPRVGGGLLMCGVLFRAMAPV